MWTPGKVFGGSCRDVFCLSLWEWCSKIGWVIFFFLQSVFERLHFSCIHSEYVLMIQVVLFKDNNTIGNFLPYNAVCFYHGVRHSQAPQSSAFAVSLSCGSSATGHVIQSETTWWSWLVRSASATDQLFNDQVFVCALGLLITTNCWALTLYLRGQKAVSMLCCSPSTAGLRTQHQWYFHLFNG